MYNPIPFETCTNKELREIIADCERELDDRTEQAQKDWREIHNAIRDLARRFPNLEIGWKDESENQMLTILDLYENIFEDIDFFGEEYD